MFEPKFPSVFDNSILQDFNCCETKGFKKHILGMAIDTAEESVHLVAGGALAKGLEEARKAFYFQGLGVSDSIAVGKIALSEAYGEERPDELKSKKKLLEVFDHYFTRWPLLIDEGVRPVEGGIEMAFPIGTGIAHPDTGEEIMYAVRIDMLGEEEEHDLLMEEEGEKILVGVDEKTTRFLDKNWVYSWDLHGQFIGYFWACKEKGWDVREWRVRGIALGRKEFDMTLDFKEVAIRPRKALIEAWRSNMLLSIERIKGNYIRFRDSGQGWKKEFGPGCKQFFSDCIFSNQCMEVPDRLTFKERRWNPLEMVDRE